jgi:hypothetical protein
MYMYVSVCMRLCVCMHMMHVISLTDALGFALSIHLQSLLVCLYACASAISLTSAFGGCEGFALFLRRLDGSMCSLSVSQRLCRDREISVQPLVVCAYERSQLCCRWQQGVRFWYRAFMPRRMSSCGWDEVHCVLQRIRKG